MSDPNQTPNPDPNQHDPNAAKATVTPEELEAVKTQIAALEARAVRAENALLDPTYVEFVATRAASKVLPAEPKAPEKKPSELTPEEFMAAVDRAADDKIAAAVDPVKQALVTKEAMDQVKEASAKYPDFWDYQKEMTDLAKRIPGLTADDAYHMAKVKFGEKPKPAPKAEPPTGMATTRIVREPAKGFHAKANDAWNKVFGKETVAH